jgi:hypothetical protein
MSLRQPRGYPLSVLQDFIDYLSQGGRDRVDPIHECELAALALFRAIDMHVGLEEARRIFISQSAVPTPERLRDEAVLDRLGEQSVKKLAWQLAKEKARNVVNPESQERYIWRLLKERPGRAELYRNLRAEDEALRRELREMTRSVEELAQQLAKEGARGISEPATHEERIWRALRERNADTIEAVRAVLETLRKEPRGTE